MKFIPEERAKKLSFDRMIFKLEPTEETLKVWDHDFEYRFDITLVSSGHFVAPLKCVIFHICTIRSTGYLTIILSTNINTESRLSWMGNHRDEQRGQTLRYHHGPPQLLRCFISEECRHFGTFLWSLHPRQKCQCWGDCLQVRTLLLLD